MPIRGFIHFLYRKKYPVNKTGVVLITGAAGGIGNFAMLELDKKGYHVFAGCRKQTDFDKLRGQLGANSQPVILDVTKDEQIAETVGKIRTYLKEKNLPFVGLVNNAGLLIPQMMETTSAKQLQMQFNVNVVGVMELTKAVLPLCRETNGRIVNITSAGAWFAMPSMSAYMGSKACIQLMSDCLRQECPDVSVSSIAPGPIKTPMLGEIQEARFAEGASPEAVSYYKHTFNYYMQCASTMMNQLTVPPSHITNCILHALGSAHPKSIYINDIMPKMMVFMSEVVPSRVMDSMNSMQFDMLWNFMVPAAAKKVEAPNEMTQLNP